MSQTVCIVSFSGILEDARVLRQVSFLSSKFRTFVVGYFDKHLCCRSAEEVLRLAASSSNLSDVQFGQSSQVDWRSCKRDGIEALRVKARDIYWLLRGIVDQHSVETRYLRSSSIRQCCSLVNDLYPDAIIANDYGAIGICGRIAQDLAIPWIIDLHEYSPDDSSSPGRGRHNSYFLRKYLQTATACVTVSDGIGDRYRQEYDVDVEVIRNIPLFKRRSEVQPTSQDRIRLVHHGGALRDRRLEDMIYAVGMLDDRFTLDLMLLESYQTGYINQLKEIANRVAPQRIRFRQAVPPFMIVDTLQQYDVGIFLLPPSNVSYELALPNKLFEFIGAGLAAVVGPSPEMARIVTNYKCGVVSQSWNINDFAEALSNLTIDDINRMKQASVQAAFELNANVEMEKFVRLVRCVMAGSYQGAPGGSELICA